MNIISVVLGADTKKFRTKDSIEIIEYTYANYEKVKLGEIIKKEFEEWQQEFQTNLFIEKGKEQNLKIEWNNPYQEFPIKKEEKVRIEIQAKDRFIAPVAENTYIGKINIFVGKEKIDEIDLVASEGMKRKDVWDYFKEIMKTYVFTIQQG